MNRTKGVLICAAAYVVAIVIAIAVGYALRSQHPLVMIGAADAAGTIVIFAFSMAFNNSSFYDPYWSVAPMVIVAYWGLSSHSEGADVLRQIVVAALVWLWGARLTFNWLRGWRGLDHEDWRYVNIRAQTGRAYWPASLAGIHLMPTIFVYLGCLPLYAAFTTTGRTFGLLDAVAAAVTLAAVCIETMADQQLRRFVQTNTQQGRVLDTGLWANSRHPNYFGEVLFWWGLFLFALAAAPDQWWTIAGAVAITGLFLFISVPLIEKRMRATKPDFEDYARKTRVLVPWFRR